MHPFVKSITKAIAAPIGILALILAAVLEGGPLMSKMIEQTNDDAVTARRNLTPVLVEPVAVYTAQKGEACLVEQLGTRRHYTFEQAPTSSVIFLIAQTLIAGEKKLNAFELGSVPDFKLVNYPCAMINAQGRKWDSVEDFTQAAKGEFDAIGAKLKPLQAAPETTRLSLVSNKIRPTP
ncbi:hypothetical protein [Micavibrio aeruginosavorus]|uniref:hypothetical protein n=1 Tax=Micavibrio aeruginosavorus TaxID=349221 RepID=UPI003F4AB89A